MIKLNENIWIGDSLDEKIADLATPGIKAILNVAQDLRGTRGWLHGIEYMQVGLVDGPGNPLSAYYSAVLALRALIDRHGQVLVCCHTKGRSMAVVIMYFNSLSRREWTRWIELLTERTDADLPVPHTAHLDAFDRMNWKLLAKITS